MTRQAAQCAHGWPARECTLHRPSHARRVLDVAVLVTLTGLDLAVVAIAAGWGWWLIGAAAEIIR